MPDLPRLPIADRCPDRDCQVPIGVKHQPGCGVAICVSTGHQRRLHHDDQLVPPVCIDIYPDRPVTGGAPLCHLGCGIPVWRHARLHICGEDVWTGLPHGAIEAAAAGLFVRREHDTGPWIACTPGIPGAVPDLTRAMQTGTWDPIQQRWIVPTQAVTGRA